MGPHRSEALEVALPLLVTVAFAELLEHPKEELRRGFEP